MRDLKGAIESTNEQVVSFGYSESVRLANRKSKSIELEDLKLTDTSIVQQLQSILSSGIESMISEFDDSSRYKDSFTPEGWLINGASDYWDMNYKGKDISSKRSYPSTHCFLNYTENIYQLLSDLSIQANIKVQPAKICALMTYLCREMNIDHPVETISLKRPSPMSKSEKYLRQFKKSLEDRFNQNKKRGK